MMSRRVAVPLWALVSRVQAEKRKSRADTERMRRKNICPTVRARPVLLLGGGGCFLRSTHEDQRMVFIHQVVSGPLQEHPKPPPGERLVQPGENARHLDPYQAVEIADWGFSMTSLTLPHAAKTMSLPTSRKGGSRRMHRKL
jgi:hypothetical protein